MSNLPKDTADQTHLIASTPARRRITTEQAIIAHATFFLTGMAVTFLPHLSNFSTSYVMFLVWFFLTIYLGMRIVRQWGEPLP
jgi:ABC-type multidrug transport system permease subunit